MFRQKGASSAAISEGSDLECLDETIGEDQVMSCVVDTCGEVMVGGDGQRWGWWEVCDGR